MQPMDELFELFPYGVVLLNQDGGVFAANQAARDLLGPAVDAEGARCCDLFRCRSEDTPLQQACLTELARDAGEALPEVRLDLASADGPGAVWVTAAPLGSDGSRTLVHLRPGDPHDRRRRTNPHWVAGTELTIYTLGRTRVLSTEGPIGGEWLGQRPGELLKYLVCQRNRRAPVHAEEIAEALWPHGDHRVVNNVRHFVHALRERLEPDRPKRAASQFVLAEHGGYRLNLDAVRIDADVFERAAETGLAAYREGDEDAAMRLLTDAVGAYAGDFLAEERYTLWVLAERERLQELAVQALMTLGTLCWQAERLGDAAAHLERVATMLPFDQDVERRLIAITLQRGHRSRARRRYMALRARMLREFGEEPDFQLADVLASVGRPRRLKWREPA
jgi:DNA-binding SARP family transcriptional activator